MTAPRNMDEGYIPGQFSEQIYIPYMTRCSTILVMKIKVTMSYYYVPIKSVNLKFKNQGAFWPGRLIPGSPSGWNKSTCVEREILWANVQQCLEGQKKKRSKVNDLGGGWLMNCGTITTQWYTDIAQNGSERLRWAWRRLARSITEGNKMEGPWEVNIIRLPARQLRFPQNIFWQWCSLPNL